MEIWRKVSDQNLKHLTEKALGALDTPIILTLVQCRHFFSGTRDNRRGYRTLDTLISASTRDPDEECLSASKIEKMRKEG